MATSRKLAAIAAITLTVTSGALVAAETEPPATSTFYACVKDGNLIPGSMTVDREPTCTGGAVLLAWNQIGPPGPKGDIGETGPQGIPGESCTVVDNQDGTFTMSCPDGTSVTWAGDAVDTCQEITVAGEPWDGTLQGALYANLGEITIRGTFVGPFEVLEPAVFIRGVGDCEGGPATIDGNGLYGLEVGPDAGVFIEDVLITGGGRGITNFGNLTLTGTTTVSGNVFDPDVPWHGGISNLGLLWLTDFASVTENIGIEGGGIRNYTGETFIEDFASVTNNTAIAHNGATGNGGGIFIRAGGVTIHPLATVTNNSADGQGGGVYRSDGAVLALVDPSVIFGNTPDDIYPTP